MIWYFKKAGSDWGGKCGMKRFFLRNNLTPLLIWYERHINLSVNHPSERPSWSSGSETLGHCYASKTIVSLHKNHCIHHSIRRGPFMLNFFPSLPITHSSSIFYVRIAPPITCGNTFCFQINVFSSTFVWILTIC